jgi:hypothetical protein
LQSSSVAKCCAPARMSASGKLRRSVESLRERQLRAGYARQSKDGFQDQRVDPLRSRLEDIHLLTGSWLRLLDTLERRSRPYQEHKKCAKHSPS